MIIISKYSEPRKRGQNTRSQSVLCSEVRLKFQLCYITLPLGESLTTSLLIPLSLSDYSIPLLSTFISHTPVFLRPPTHQALSPPAAGVLPSTAGPLPSGSGSPPLDTRPSTLRQRESAPRQQALSPPAAGVRPSTAGPLPSGSGSPPIDTRPSPLRQRESAPTPGSGSGSPPLDTRPSPLRQPESTIHNSVAMACFKLIISRLFSVACFELITLSHSLIFVYSVAVFTNDRVERGQIRQLFRRLSVLSGRFGT